MRVYKFLSANYGLEALKNRRLRISRISDLNDPFELLGTDLSNQELRTAFMKMKNALNKDNGLLCFSKRWRNPLLWGHYSDKHRGLCLGFDVPDELLMSVIYTRKRTTSEKLFSSDPSVQETEMNRMLRTKFSHWRYENEVRCFISLDYKFLHNGNYFLEFSNKMKIRQVLVGAEASISRFDIEKALGEKNAQVERFKTRAAFKTFNVVRNRRQSLWV